MADKSEEDIGRGRGFGEPSKAFRFANRLLAGIKADSGILPFGKTANCFAARQAAHATLP